MRDHQRERELQEFRANDFRRKCVPERPACHVQAWGQLARSTPRHSVSHPPMRLSWERRRERETCGEPPLAGVDLCPDHTHDLLLHLGLLRVNVGVTHLAVLVPAQTGAAHQPTLTTLLYLLLYFLIVSLEATISKAIQGLIQVRRRS